MQRHAPTSEPRLKSKRSEHEVSISREEIRKAVAPVKGETLGDCVDRVVGLLRSHGVTVEEGK